MAMPVKIILLVEIKLECLVFNPLANQNIIKVVVTANKNETGVITKKGSDTGSIKRSIAPSPAPAEMPRSPGSARLFRSIPCNITPEQDRDAPTIAAFKILGNLISIRILLLASFPLEKIPSISLKEMDTLPRLIDIIKEKHNMIDKTNSIKTFLDNN